MTKWIKEFVDNGNKNLICIPFAGGYSASFRPLAQHFKVRDWKVITLDPPGHGGNRMELISDLDYLATLYVSELAKYLKGDFILFGHSMGGLIVHRMAQILEEKNMNPLAVIISAISPPGDIKVSRKYKDNEILNHIISLDAIPDEILKHKDFLEMYLPVFKSDFFAIDNYRIPSSNKIQAPIYLFGGTNDVHCSRSQIMQWMNWAHNAHFVPIEGGHMFLTQDPKNVADKLEKIIVELTDCNMKCYSSSEKDS